MALAVSFVLPRGAAACTLAPWVAEERVLHIAGGIGSLPPNVTPAEAGNATGAQIGQVVMMLRLCGWAEQEAGFKAPFGLQTSERLGFTPVDAARVYDQAVVDAAEMTQGFGADPRALTIIWAQMCQPALRDNLTQSIANGTVF